MPVGKLIPVEPIKQTNVSKGNPDDNKIYQPHQSITFIKSLIKPEN